MRQRIAVKTSPDMITDKNRGIEAFVNPAIIDSGSGPTANQHNFFRERFSGNVSRTVMTVF